MLGWEHELLKLLKCWVPKGELAFLNHQTEEREIIFPELEDRRGDCRSLWKYWTSLWDFLPNPFTDVLDYFQPKIQVSPASLRTPLGFLASVHAKSFHSCPTFCDPMDSSPPGSSVHEILQARILEWVAMSSSRGSSLPGDWICISYVSCIGRWVLYHWSHVRSPLGLLITVQKKKKSISKECRASRGKVGEPGCHPPQLCHWPAVWDLADDSIFVVIIFLIFTFQSNIRYFLTVLWKLCDRLASICIHKNYTR